MNDAAPTPAQRETAAAGRIRRRIGAHDARDRRQRRITLVLLTAVGVLLVNSLVGENGYLATLRAGREEAALGDQVARVRVENQQLQIERRRLQSDPDAIEETVRESLGAIHPGETVIVVEDAAPIPPDAPVR